MSKKIYQSINTITYFDTSLNVQKIYNNISLASIYNYKICNINKKLNLTNFKNFPDFFNKSIKSQKQK